MSVCEREGGHVKQYQEVQKNKKKWAVSQKKCWRLTLLAYGGPFGRRGTISF